MRRIDSTAGDHGREPVSSLGPVPSVFGLSPSFDSFWSIMRDRRDVAQDHDSLKAYSDDPRVLDSRAILPFSEDWRSSVRGQTALATYIGKCTIRVFFSKYEEYKIYTIGRNNENAFN